jgi:hypothetical protein
MLALPLLTLLLAAPPPEQARAEALLASSRPIDKAWGAYLAGRLNLTPLIPRLTAELTSLDAAAEDFEGRSLRHVLFDALIELRAPVTFELLKPWFDRYRDETLILLLLDAKANQQALLEIRPALRRQSQWLAVNNALVRQRAPGMAARLLAEANVRHHFFLIDTPNPGIRGGVPGGGSNSFGSVAFPAGFPPSARYRIVTYASPGDPLLAPGPTNVYFSRAVIATDSHIGWSNNTDPLDIQAPLVDYLAALMYCSPERAREAITGETTVNWSDANAFRKRASDGLDRQAKAILEMTEVLTQQGLLTPRERSTLEVQIQPIMEDLRRHSHQPVLVIPARRVSLAAARP